MKLNSYSLISIIVIFLIAIFSFFTIKTPLSKRISSMKEINVVFFTPEPILFEINSMNKNLIIKEINTKKDFTRSKLDTAFQIITEYASNSEDVFYFETNKYDLNIIIESIKNWKEKPVLLLTFFKKMTKTKTNLNIFDKINLTTELLKIRKNGILNIKITITNLNQDNEKSPNQSPLVSMIIHHSKLNISKKIINEMKKNQIDIIEERNTKKTKYETYIEVNNEKNIDIAKKIITILKQKKNIPIKINPKTIYDVTINIGEDFE